MITALIRSHKWYLTAALLFSVYEILQIRQGLWIGDFWEHAAVVHELTQHPWNPSNPILLSDTDHSFFSPYSLLQALTGRMLHLSAILTLELFAFINLIFFLVSLRFFCGRILRDRTDVTSALALVFIVFFWGQQGDKWSGFFHLRTFHFGLPYPSTFCAALGFFLLGTYFKKTDHKVWLWMLPGLIFILLSHPPTWLWLCLAMFTASFCHPSKNKSGPFIISALVVICFLIGLIWPYFDLWLLFTNGNPLFHAQSEELYTGITKKYWPFLILPLFFFVGRKEFPFTWLSASAASMLLIYFTGFATKNYGVGRIISACALFMQILIAFQIPFLFQHDRKGKGLVIITCTVIMFTTLLNVYNEKHMFNAIRSVDKTYYTRYYFLNQYAKDSLVLSDSYSNTFLPALGIKVLTWTHPLYNMPDQSERNRELREFYHPGETTSKRLNLIKKYSPSFLLIDSSNTIHNKDQLLMALNAKLVVQEHGLGLYKLKNE